jgi:phosphoserine phosphatase RsbU/P
MPRLTFQNGRHAGMEHTFEASVIVGRASNADLTVDDHSVSRRHAMLKCVGNECFLLDLGSVNGTFLNGRPVSKPMRLREGDIVRLGKVLARFGDTAASVSDTRAESPVHWMDPAQASPQLVVAMPADEAPVEPLDMQEAKQAIAAMAMRLRLQSRLGSMSGGAFDERALLSFVLDELFVAMPQADSAVIMLPDGSGGFETCASKTRSPGSRAVAFSRTLVSQVTARREAVLLIGVETAGGASVSESIVSLGIRSAICVPLVFDGQVYGVIQAVTSSRDLRFGKTDVSLLIGIAAQLAMGVAYARLHARLVEQELIDRDLDLARRIQQHFLPDGVPCCEGYSFAVEFVPASGVAGDFYDFLDLPDGLLGIAVGDVCGKGIPAALYAAKLTSDLRYEAAGEREPAAILRRLNRALTRRNDEGMFATMVLGVLNPQTGELVVSSAGHPLPLFRDKNGRVETLGRTGSAPIALSGDTTFQQYSYKLERSEAVVIYSDGISEAMNESGEIYGQERLVETVAAAPPIPETIRYSVMNSVGGFIGRAKQSDDITLLAFTLAAPAGR